MDSSHHEPPKHIRVDSVGRVVIPVDLRERFGIKPGDELTVIADKNGLQLQTFDQALSEAQAYFSKFVVPGESIVDELIAERREEAKREYGD